MTQCPNCGIEIEMKPVRQPSGPDVIIPFVAGTDNLHDTISCLENQLSALRARHDGGDRGGTDMNETIPTPVTVQSGDPLLSEWQSHFLRNAKWGIVLIGYGPSGKAKLDQIAAALNAVAKLPRTDDGVPMVPKGRYWGYCRDKWAEGDDPFELLELVWWRGGGDDCFNPEFTLVDDSHKFTLVWEFFNVEGVYSTRAAAEAARENTHAR